MKVKIGIGVALLVVLVVVAVVLLTGGDDEQTAKKGSDEPAKSAEETATTDEEPSDEPDDTGGAAATPPLLRTFASDRAEGLKASAQADGLVRRPKEIWLRVSAAPKQKVRVSWNLTCGQGANAIDDFIVTPPEIRKIGPPKNKNKVCPVSAAAQLEGTGRLKIALLRDR